MNRVKAPNYIQPNKLEIQFPKEITFANGVKFFWIEDVKDNSVKLDIEWCAGSKYQSKKLVANFTNKLLLSGNSEKSGADIAEEMDYYGGFLQYEMDRDHAGISLYGLAENMSSIFSVFANAFMSCGFPEKNFEKERTVGLNRFQIESKKVKSVCRRKFNKAVFGKNSDYGQLAEEEDFEAINREDLITFHKDYYLGTKPTIFLVGKGDKVFMDKLQSWAESLGGDFPKFNPKPLLQQKGRLDVSVDNAIQSAIRFGRLMFDKNDPDYFKFQLLNTVLGGYFGSRLMSNIREDKGYTYGIGSGMSTMQDAAYFFISTEVAVEVREDTISEVHKELARLRDELIPEDELIKVKNYMLGDFLRHADGSIAMMETFKNIYFNKLKTTYYTDFIQTINQCTAEELREVARNYLKEEDLVIVTAG